MNYREDLVVKLTGTLRVERAVARGALKLSMAWPRGDIDIPAVCNHLARHLKVPSVTVIRRTPPGQAHLDGGYSAVLRIAGLTDTEVSEMLRSLCKDLRGLAMIIVSAGT